jgi:hypothetical protein
MRMRAFLTVGFLGFALATVTLAQQQGKLDKLSKEHQHEHLQGSIASVAALRAEVAKLRAEVDLLELEHEANKTPLLAELKRRANSDPEYAETEAEGTFAMMTGRATIKQQLSDDEEALKRVAEKVIKEHAERDQVEYDRKKKAFVKQATELHERSFLLADLEKQLSNAK